MTISYRYNLASSSVLGFGKLLLHWRGSVYKLIYRELGVYAVAFLLISLIYRNFMSPDQRTAFERVALYCGKTLDLIPLSFVLGFYVTFVITRWWNQFATIPWPDRLMHVIQTYVSGTDERGRVLRRTLIRYVNLSSIILFQSISGAVKRRFPTVQHLVNAGFLTWEEKHLLDKVETSLNKHFLPMVWFINLVNVASSEGRIEGPSPLRHLVEEVNAFSAKTGMLWCYDWVTVPLVYTQVVTMVTHLFFVACLFARQYLDTSKSYPNNQVDLYFPFFTFLQFMFFMGWLKVAEQLINPFGEDDDDFETNWIIDRNLQMSYLVVDELYGQVPRIEKDLHWPYPECEFSFFKNPPIYGNTHPGPEKTSSKESAADAPVGRCSCLSRRRERVKNEMPKTLGHKLPLLNEKYLNILNRGNFEGTAISVVQTLDDDVSEAAYDNVTMVESDGGSPDVTEPTPQKVILEPEVCWKIDMPS